MRNYYKLVITLFVILLALALPSTLWSKPTVRSMHSDPDAVEAVQNIYNTVFSLHEFKADVNLIIQNEEFLKGFFPEDGSLSTTGIKGILHYTSKNGCDLLLRREANEYNCFSIGSNTNYIGLRTITNRKGSNILRISEVPDPVASPDVSPSPSPSASPEPNPSPSPEISGFTPPDILGKLSFEAVMHLLTPTRHSASRDFPLSFVLPYEISSRLHGNVFTLVKSDAYVYNTRCQQIDVSNPRTTTKTTLWIDNERKRLLQVMRSRTDDSTKIIATYSGSYETDKETGFTPYQRLETSVNGIPVFIAELTNPEINPKKAVVEKDGKNSKDSKRNRFNNIISDEVVPFLSENMTKLVIILFIALMVLGIRYTMFATSRQEFSDEILIIDEHRGRFTETLSKLGYKLVPFSAEAIGAERQLLGKGATKETTARPRAVIVAPQSFDEVRNQAYLLRAYVEGGGRVLVMHHTKKMENSFPYHAELVPIPNVGITVQEDINTLTGLKEEEIRRLVATYVTNEAYLNIEGKKCYKPIISLVNKLTNVKATTVGAFKWRKGEYIVCQMHITNASLMSDTSLQLMFNDIIRYLLGLEPIQYDDNAE